MLFGSDRSLALAANFGPCSFWEDGPREPTEIESQVVKPSQIMRHTISVSVDDREQIFAGGLDKRFAANGVVGSAAKSTSASLLRGWNSVGCHFIHHGLPRSPRHFWIVRGEVSASEVEVESRLSVRFVQCV